MLTATHGDDARPAQHESEASRQRRMTWFEAVYRGVRVLDHPLYQHVSRRLFALQRQAGRPLRLLDVGGRRSNYTIGLTAEITVTDVPRQEELQHALDLGATQEMRHAVVARRSNVVDYLFDDMTRTRLPAESFDVAAAVEVLEHVEEDAAFVENLASVLKPGGVFVMTTPNGDFLPNPYADHKRHYRRAQLAELLSRFFGSVQVEYVVNAGKLITYGTHPLKLSTPVRSLFSPCALFLSTRLEQWGAGGQGPVGKRHLLAVARKA